MDEVIREFHCHVYYQAGTRESASAMRERMLHLAGARLRISSLSDGVRGPHVNPMFGVHMQVADMPEVVGWLMRNHGPHPVLLHPETGNDLLDHTHHAFWLGEPQPLDLSVLA